VASTQALGPVTTAMLAVLRNSVSLTGYVGTRVYPDTDGCGIPAKVTYPYVSVEGAGETPANTMGGSADVAKFGSDVKVYIRIGSTARSDSQAWSILGILKGLLDGQPLTVSGYPNVSVVTYEDVQKVVDTVGGQVVREWVASFDVVVHQ